MPSNPGAMRIDSPSVVRAMGRALPVVLLAIGLLYAGPLFLANFTTAVPSDAGGGQLATMPPGDYFEQFYRYSLVGNNLSRGYSPYFSGYQYAAASGEKAFTEGWIFFPFSALSAALGMLIGDIAAYNSIALLSFVLAGMAAFALVRETTGSTGAGFLAAVVFAALPFRIGFLFGEMVFGVDMGLLPFIVLFLERTRRTLRVRDAVLFGCSCLLLATANFSLLYWFVVLSSPYLVLRGWQAVRGPDRSFLRALAKGALLPLGLAAAYLVYTWRLVAASGLGGGQSLKSLLVYSPEISNYFVRMSGESSLAGFNEKILYLGFALVAMLLMMATKGIAAFRTGSRERGFTAATLACFAIAYLLALGPNLDRYVGIGIYEALFNHLPGANGTRTPGRLMAVAGLWFCVAAGIAWSHWICSAAWRMRTEAALLAVASVVIVIDYWYAKPTMARMDFSNRAYAAVAGPNHRVLGVPFRMLGQHYYNATFLPYALKYDLRMFNGHSSLYPRGYGPIARRLQALNEGEMSVEEWTWLKDNGFRFIVVHNTAQEPRTSDMAVRRLRLSPFLRFVESDAGISAFEIRATAAPAANDDRELKSLMATLARGPIEGSANAYLWNWYPREVYAGQEPFRWMRGIGSIYVWRVADASERSADGRAVLKLRYKCPQGELEVKAVGGQVDVIRGSADPQGWQRLQVLADPKVPILALKLNAAREYRVPTDPRTLGCALSDAAGK